MTIRTTHFRPSPFPFKFLFLSLLNTLKKKLFMMVSRVLQRENWPKMGSTGKIIRNHCHR